MPSLRLGPAGFVLGRGLNDAALRALSERGLEPPEWDATLRAWAYGTDEASVLAVDHLVATGALEPEPPARRELDELCQHHGVPGPAARLAALQAQLRPYQAEGVAYLLAKRRAVLADAMGLGKSLQALVAVERAQAYPCIVVAPAAVKLGWSREVMKWLPWRSLQVLWAGKDRLRGAALTVVNPELLGRHLEALRETGPQSVVLDEAHFFKNPAARRSQDAQRLVEGVPYRFALTGTPVKNRRDDLLHQLRILGQLEEVLRIYRGLLPHWWKPEKGPLSEAHAAAALERLDGKTLGDRLREVCMLRRTKREVAPDLPPLERTRLDVVLAHPEAYREKEAAMLDWVRKWQAAYGQQARAMEAGAVFEFRAHLTRLRRQSALGKLDAVRQWAEPLLGSGERVILFAHHRDVVAALADALPGKVATITGATKPEARRAILDALDRFDFLAATMDATGYGVDGIQLHASHVAFVELDWTPTKHEQCEGRLHRIGQTEPVNAWYFVAASTIDGAMMDVLERKWADIQGVVEAKPGDEAGFLEQVLRRQIAQMGG